MKGSKLHNFHFETNYPFKSYFFLHNLDTPQFVHIPWFSVDKSLQECSNNWQSCINICHYVAGFLLNSLTNTWWTLSVQAHHTDTLGEVYAVLTRPCLLPGSHYPVSRVWVCATALRTNLLNNFHSSYGCLYRSLSLTHTHTHWHTSANIQTSERLIPLAIASMGGPAVTGFARLPCWSLTHRNTISLSLSVPEHLSAVCGWDWERPLHVSQKTATRELIATMTTIPITV